MRYNDIRIKSLACSTQVFGFAPHSELGIHTFFTNRHNHTNEDYDADTIMKIIVFSRLLSPASKKKSYENRSRFFEVEGSFYLVLLQNSGE